MPVFVNKIEITDEQIHNEMQYHPAESVEEARFLSAKSLVVKKLFVLESIEQNLITEEEEDDVVKIGEAVDQMLDKYVNIPEITDDAIETYYNANKEKFKDPKTNQKLELDLVRHLINDYLTTQSMRTGASLFIHQLAQKYDIVGINVGGSTEGFTSN